MASTALPETLEFSQNDRGIGAKDEPPEPGLLVLFAAGRPTCAWLPMASGRLEFGRAALVAAGLDDLSVSRSHAQIFWDGRLWTVRDVASRNGTFLDGVRVTERVAQGTPIVRFGRMLTMAVPHGRAFAGALSSLSGSPIVGARMAGVNREIAQSARTGVTLHVRGESGSGKELAARHFHASGPRAPGPFVAVNCAAIPEGIAERLLFGAVRGAYSGADASADGYVQAAGGGTLFLDEIAELDRSVQAKLLRVIETRQVTALGASRPRDVDLGICSATHRELRAAVADGAFREDLYFRLGRPQVCIPPLRERREEIAFHAFRALSASDASLGAEATFIEALLLLHWPGNVRELHAEVATAARRAMAAGCPEVSIEHLANEAGRAIAPSIQAPRTPSPEDRPAGPPSERPSPAKIAAALEEHQGNVSAAARALGVHRTQLRRWMKNESSGQG
jgi:transcriptional regulator with PAS, ATPase and Fis domain